MNESKYYTINSLNDIEISHPVKDKQCCSSCNIFWFNTNINKIINNNRFYQMSEFSIYDDEALCHFNDLLLSRRKEVTEIKKYKFGGKFNSKPLK